jgi:peptidylprolyl isomerase
MTLRKNWILVLLLVALTASVACGDEDAGNGDAAQGGDCDTESVETEEGLIYKNVECGDGAEPESGDTISVHYTGRLEDGTEFDSSEGGEPIQFVLGAGQVIEGWDLGFEGMKVGGKRELTIPPALGYGAQGAPPTIPPNATLIFDVELVDVAPAES